VVFPVSSARYVRFKVLTAHGGERVAIAGLSIRRSLDLAPVLVASASSEHLGYEASNALDNDPATFWHSEWEDGQHLPQWLQVDMGDTVTIDQLSYLPRQAQENGRIAAYAVLLSVDGSSFFTATQGSWPNAAGLQTARFPASEARYVRLVALDAYGSASVASVARALACSTPLSMSKQPNGRRRPPALRLALRPRMSSTAMC